MNQIVELNTTVQRLPMRTLVGEEINQISGGNPVLIAAAAVAAGFGALNAAESFGEKIGKAIYYMSH